MRLGIKCRYQEFTAALAVVMRSPRTRASPSRLKIATNTTPSQVLLGSSLLGRRRSKKTQSFACKPKDWDCANLGALMTWRSKMSDVPAGFDRKDAMILGLIKAVQALTAVTYHTSAKRDALENQLKTCLDSQSTGLQGDLLKSYKAPIEGMLTVIEEIKAAQSKA
jgi:hypothetical protein